MGTDKDLPRWVGCPPPESRAFDNPNGPLVVRVADVEGFVVSWIRLFGPQGAPEYMVVVGKVLPQAA